MSEKIRSWLIFLVVVVAVLFFGFGCYYMSRVTSLTTVYKPVTRVFMHETNRFSFYFQESGRGDTVSVRTYYDYDGPIILCDVAPDQSLWVEVRTDSSGLHKIRHLTFHLRCPEDVEGGGWNHGKFGRGTTTVVE